METGKRVAPKERTAGTKISVLRILIADDDPGVRELLREMVEGLGYEAVTVPDGMAALNAIAAERPDLILMDLQLPDMTGYEATRGLKANSDTASIPVVAMTAQACVPKPFRKEGLIVAIQAALAGMPREKPKPSDPAAQ